MALHLNFTFSSYIGLLYLVFFVSCSNNLPAGSFKSEVVDSNSLFFSGEYSLINGESVFYDCATGCSYFLSSTDQIISDINIDYAKITNNKGGSIFATCKGHIIEDRELYVEDIISFELGYTCNPTKITGIYISNSDTLTLHNNYCFSYSYQNGRKQELLEGIWGRSYDDEGVLYIDKEEAIPFFIHFGGEHDKKDIFLTLNSIVGKDEILLPH